MAQSEQIVKIVALEAIGVSSEVSSETRKHSRHCIACAYKEKLHPPDPRGSIQEEPILFPVEPILPEPAPEFITAEVAPAPITVQPTHTMVKSENDNTDALEDRDPNKLNQHLQIVWDDIIGEPEGARGPECSWRLSNACFERTRDICYTLLSVLLAPPCALLLGCGFACLAFEQIWCTTPCLRCAKIYFASLRSIVRSCMAATVVPTAEAIGHVCRHIRVNSRRDASEDPDLLVV